MQTPFWISDPGHGWLCVPTESVIASGATISEFSYRSPDGQLSYLEEDCDAPAYLEAIQALGRSFPEQTLNGDAPLRRFRRYPAPRR